MRVHAAPGRGETPAAPRGTGAEVWGEPALVAGSGTAGPAVGSWERRERHLCWGTHSRGAEDPRSKYTGEITNCFFYINYKTIA